MAPSGVCRDDIAVLAALNYLNQRSKPCRMASLSLSVFIGCFFLSRLVGY